MGSRPLKIAIISHALGGGGAERFSALLGVMLNNEGFSILHITITDRIDYRYAGALLNLGKIKGPVFIKKIAKAYACKKYLIRQKVDVVIDNRARGNFIKECFYKYVYGSCKVVYVVHSYNLRRYFPATAFLAKLLYKNTLLVAVSNAIARAIQINFDLPARTIYNPVMPFTGAAAAAPDANYFLFLGRFDDAVKNFRLMIDAFAASGVYENGYKLVFLGDGPDENMIRQYASEAHIKDAVLIFPFVSNPSEIIKKARAIVLTSRFEGFPMSLVESLMLGTPVIAVDCASGPSEIIKNRVNGLLVPNNNVTLLAEGFNLFVQNEELYHLCKANTADSVLHLSVENTVSLWKQILLPRV
jgi:glycosyltransferase involved in cell wall biosynthesis